MVTSLHDKSGAEPAKLSLGGSWAWLWRHFAAQRRRSPKSSPPHTKNVQMMPNQTEIVVLAIGICQNKKKKTKLPPKASDFVRILISNWLLFDSPGGHKNRRKSVNICEFRVSVGYKMVKLFG